MGSDQPEDYQPLAHEETSEDRRQDNSLMALIVAYKASHLSLTGSGTIDGNGLQLALNIDSLHHAGVRIDPHYNTRRMRPGETARPKLFFMTVLQIIILMVAYDSQIDRILITQAKASISFCNNSKNLPI